MNNCLTVDRVHSQYYESTPQPEYAKLVAQYEQEKQNQLQSQAQAP